MSDIASQVPEETIHHESEEPLEPVTPKAKTQNALPVCNTCHKRRPAKGCTMQCCVTCCNDSVCEVHMKLKEQKVWKKSVLAGTTDVQKQAALLRKRRLAPGTFREPLFMYVGDSIVLWNLRDYVKNPKWKEEAIRKSKRRSAGKVQYAIKRRPFAQIVDELYKKSLRSTDNI